MSNVSNENSQNPAGTPVLRSNEGRVPCPHWCVSHVESKPDHPDDHNIVHSAGETEAGGMSIELIRTDFLIEGRPGAVDIMFDGRFLTVQQATAVAGALATTAAKDTSNDRTIVRTRDLPQGTDYVLHDDIGVVVLSSRLDEPRRLRVLSDLGLT